MFLGDKQLYSILENQIRTTQQASYTFFFCIQEALVLVILTAIVVFCVIVSKLTTAFEEPLDKNIYTPVSTKWNDNWNIIKW